MFTILLPLLAAGFTPQPPTTVNGQVLGDAVDLATTGPARVCLEDMVVSLNDGETVYLEYLGIHDGRLRLVLGDGTYVSLVHGDAFRDQRRPGQEPAIRRAGQHYYLIGNGASLRHQMFVLHEDIDDYRQVLLVSGTALTGDQSDLQIFDRLSFDAEQVQHCDRRFGYGWDGIFWTTPARDEPE